MIFLVFEGVGGLVKNIRKDYDERNYMFTLDTMGQKANPLGLRLGINRSWDSLWYSRKSYASLLCEDIAIRKFLEKNLATAGVSRIVIERPQKKPHVTVYASRPGVVIGKKGTGFDQLVEKLKRHVGVECAFNVVELRKPELYAKVVADDIAQQIERRVFYKRAMRKAIQSALKMGALGIKIHCSGRLGGAEIARTDGYLEGRLPLHSFRSDIDFSSSTAHTQNGTVGVKVWIYRGDILTSADGDSDRRFGEVSLNKLG
jgi:small subunit ribosomal protein S3